MKRLLSLRELRALFNGTDLGIITLNRQSRIGGANYRLQIRGTTGRDVVDVWGNYQSMAELHDCGVFRWALERVADLLPEYDERQVRIRRVLGGH